MIARAVPDQGKFWDDRGTLWGNMGWFGDVLGGSGAIWGRYGDDLGTSSFNGGFIRVQLWIYQSLTVNSFNCGFIEFNCGFIRVLV